MNVSRIKAEREMKRANARTGFSFNYAHSNTKNGRRMLHRCYTFNAIFRASIRAAYIALKSIVWRYCATSDFHPGRTFSIF